MWRHGFLIKNCKPQLPERTPNAVNYIAKEWPQISVLVVVMLRHNRKGHGEEENLDKVVKLEHVQINDNVLDHSDDMRELLDDLHQLKSFTETQQDFKNNDALRREHHNAHLLLEENVDEAKKDMGDVQVVPCRREVF